MDLSLALPICFENTKLAALHFHHRGSPGSSYLRLSPMAFPTFLLRPPARSPSLVAGRAGVADTEQAEPKGAGQAAGLS